MSLLVNQQTTEPFTKTPSSRVEQQYVQRLPNGAKVRVGETPHFDDPMRPANNNMGIDPLENRYATPELGRIVPGILDPNVQILRIVDEKGRPMLHPSAAPSHMPAIPGVKGSGAQGLQQRLDAARHKIGGDMNSDILRKLQHLVGQGGGPDKSAPQVPLKQQGNLRQWRV